MKRFWEQLTKSQKRSLIAGLLFVAGAAILQIIVFPYFDSRKRVEAAIAANEKTLLELASLGREYEVLRRRSEEIRRVIEKRPSDFALFSYLEKKAAEAGLKAHIKSLNPMRPVSAGAYEEISVEIKIDKLTIGQLTNFLYMVESPEQMVRIRKISIDKMKDTPEYLSADIHVFAYQKPAPGGV